MLPFAVVPGSHAAGHRRVVQGAEMIPVGHPDESPRTSVPCQCQWLQDGLAIRALLGLQLGQLWRMEPPAPYEVARDEERVQVLRPTA